MSIERTRAEFTRQAAPMAEALAFQAAPVTERILGALGVPPEVGALGAPPEVGALGPAPLGRVLDLACGPGLVCAALAPHASEVVGVDATPRMLELARERVPGARFEEALAEALPFPDASFDAAVTRLSFHHFVEPAAAARELGRVVRPGGAVVVADLVASPADQAPLREALERLRDPSHVRTLSCDEVTAALEGAGLVVEEVTTWRHERAFQEWAAIVDDASRTEPLGQVMGALARAGLGAGLALREEEGRLLFTYTWQLARARVPGAGA